MANRQIIPPTEYPLSLDEAKEQLNEITEDRDVYITRLIKTASEFCQQRTQRSMGLQTREETRDQFPANGLIELPYPPIVGIVSVKYLDADGVEQTLSPESYMLDNASDSQNGFLAIAPGHDWPSTYQQINAVRVRYQSGYEDVQTVPEPLKQWMRMQVGHWDANRESVIVGGVTGVYDYVENLLDEYRVY